MGVAVAFFAWLASMAGRHPISVHVPWMVALIAASLALLALGGILLWKRTRFC